MFNGRLATISTIIRCTYLHWRTLTWVTLRMQQHITAQPARLPGGGATIAQLLTYEVKIVNCVYPKSPQWQRQAQTFYPYLTAQSNIIHCLSQQKVPSRRNVIELIISPYIITGALTEVLTSRHGCKGVPWRMSLKILTLSHKDKANNVITYGWVLDFSLSFARARHYDHFKNQNGWKSATLKVICAKS